MPNINLQIEYCKMLDEPWAYPDHSFLYRFVVSHMRNFKGERQFKCKACESWKWEEEKCKYFEEDLGASEKE